MVILVTGGAGYIGSHTCIELLNSGYEVVVVDSFINSKPEVLERVQKLTGKTLKFYKIDLLDSQNLEVVFAENKIEAVIHFAGLKAVGESIKIPIRYYHNNITGTMILCEVMQKYGVKKMVFSSSATVYGKPNRVPIDEESPLRTTNPYGSSKLMIEEIMRDVYISDNDWSIILLRYFNPVGAHPSGQIGEDPNGIPKNLVPYITQVAVGKLDEIEIFGCDYPTVDGTGVRDYIHVMDLAAGHLKSVEKIMFTSGVEAYNLGTGIGYSVLEMIKAFEKVIGTSIPFTISARRPGDIAECYAGTEKAKRDLLWTAKRGLEEMCADAWRWQSLNPNGYDGQQ